MLDFYTISKNQDTPEFPEQIGLELIGDIDLKTFINLQKKGIVEDRFSYFDDFRWSSSYIRGKLIEIEHSNDTDIIGLKSVLTKAQSEDKELVAYCD